MLRIPFTQKRTNVFDYIYLVTFLLSFHTFFVTYINSSFLGQYVGENKVGLLYALGSIINIFILLRINHILEKFGNYKTMIFMASLEILALAVMASSQNVIWIVLAFVVHQIMNSVLFLNLDEFLESTSDKTKTGYLRGIFNTVISITAVVCPVIVGSILAQGNYSSVYIFSALFLLPLIFIVLKRFKKLKDNEYHKIHVSGGFQIISKDKNLRNIYLANLILHIFYSWMVIYVPIYLHSTLGFSWEQLGLMISIALLPFVLFEIPVGSLADKKMGEKEILITGFFIISLGLIAMTISTSADFVLWTAMLFFTRIGASFVEITTESYFFKHVNSKNQNILSIFRTTRPVGYILGPILGSILLFFVDQRFMFLSLAIIVLCGVRSAWVIKDTR